MEELDSAGYELLTSAGLLLLEGASELETGLADEDAGTDDELLRAGVLGAGQKEVYHSQ